MLQKTQVESFEFGKGTHVVFVDFKLAYDHNERQRIYEVLEE